MKKMGKISACITALIGLICLSGLAYGNAPPTFESNGQLFFPLGWYTGPTQIIGEATDLAGKTVNAEGYFNNIKSHGLNFVIPYVLYFHQAPDDTIPPCNPENANAILTAGDNTGVKLVMQLDMDCVRYSSIQGHLDHQIAVAKDHSSLFAWYTDEPEFYRGGSLAPEEMLWCYNYVKARDDKNHPYLMVFSHTAYSDSYMDSFDCFGEDTYTVWSGDPEFSSALWVNAVQAKEGAQKAEANGKKGFMEVLQGFDDMPDWDVRLPTYGEQRYMAYSSIVQGARGLMWWIEYRCTDPNYLANVIGPICQEIGPLKYALASNSHAVTVTSNHDADTTGHGLNDIAYVFGEDNYGAYVIAVNNTNATINNVNFTLAGVSAGYQPAITVKYESRSLTPSVAGTTWTITDNFTQYAAHVYYIARTSPLVPILNVTPSSLTVNAVAGQTDIAIINSGQGVLPWTATVTSGSEWLTLSYSSMAITAKYPANTTLNSRTATIRVTTTGEGATGGPIDVTVVQQGSSTLKITNIKDVMIVANYGFGAGDEDDPNMILREYWFPNSTYDLRGFMKIDLSEISSLPAGSVITGVTFATWYLDDWSSGNTPNMLDMGYTVDEFDVLTLTYQTYDGLNAWTDGNGAGVDGYIRRHPNFLGSVQVNTGANDNRYVTISTANLANYIQAQSAAGKAAYLEFSINDSNGQYQWFYSSDYPDPNKRPYLQINYAAPTVPSVLAVDPATRNVGWKVGTATFDVSNSGGPGMTWMATVTSGAEWLSITSSPSGTDNGTITVNFLKNGNTVSSRTATIRIVADGATGSPKDVTVVQARAPISGDANGDGMVDVGDLGILAANYGGSGKTWEQGDFNDDGLVDVGDLGILAANYGTGVNASVDFNADYAKAFGTTVADDVDEEDNSTSVCGALGLPLIAGLMLMGLMLVKLEE